MRRLLSFPSNAAFSILAVLAFVMLAFPASPAVWAQKKADESEEETSVADAVDAPLKAKDGLRMACRYYPGPEEKSTIPVILVHGIKGQGSDMEGLAKFLQSQGHSVIVPDLRGHGESLEIKPEGAQKSVKVNPARFGKREFEAIVKFDLEAAKSFLMKKHHAGAVNIDALTLIGADMGALASLYYGARDWSWKPLAGIKQGQDVKAIVLLSPPTSFKGATPQTAFKQPGLQNDVSLMVLSGRQDNKASSAAKRLVNTVKRFRGQQPDDPEEKDVVTMGLATQLQGADLLIGELPTYKFIGKFIEFRVQNRMEDNFPWKERRQAN